MHGTVFLVDDDLALLHALSEVLDAHDFQVRAFASAEAFLDAYRDDAAACAVLDINLPGLSGIEAQRVLRKRGIDLPIIFLTGHGDVPTSVRAVKDGAFDFLEKPAPADTLIDRVQSALALDEARRVERSRRREARMRLAELTARERQVLDRMLSGKTAKVIARELGISPRTIEVHRKHVLLKTGTANLLQLSELAQLAQSDAPDRA